MAITWGNTKITGGAETDRESVGGTIPTVTETAGIRYIQSREINITKSTIENADETITFNALISAVDTALSGIVTNDYVATNTVNAYGEVSGISTGVIPKYGDTADLYVCTCKIYVVVT